MRTVLLISLCTVSLFAFQRLASQNEAIQWYFYYGSTLNFSTTPPSTFAIPTGSNNNPSNSFCDSNGNLLFYTNGLVVWNKTHSIMTNGTGLIGSNNPNSVLIVPSPGNTNQYYIFHVKASTGFSSGDGLYYSIVDMSLSGGSGSVTSKNIQLYSGPLCFKISGTRHCNGIDYWIVVKDAAPTNSCPWSGIYSFRAYGLSSAGASTIASISTFTYSAPNTMSGSRAGQLKISPDGKKLVSANYNYCAQYNPAASSFELYDFDKTTGQVSNYTPLYNNSNPGTGFYNSSGFGVEFSPDCSKLYGTLCNNMTYPNGSLLQWDLCVASSSLVAGTQTPIAAPNHTINGFTSLQLGPDGKIYVAPYNAPQNVNILSVINSPNLYGAACNFSLYSQGLNYKFNSFYLPNFMGSIFFLASSVPAFSLSLVNNPTGCLTQQFQTPLMIGDVVGNCPINTFTVQGLQWDFGDPGSGPGNFSSLPNPSHTYSLLGLYHVKLTLDFGCGGGKHTITQTVNITSPNLPGNYTYSSLLPCFGSTTGVAVFNTSLTSGVNYSWTNGINSYTTPSINNLSAGTWTSLVTNTITGCQAYTVISIQEPSQVIAGISGSTVCPGNTISAFANGGTAPYYFLWSNGAITATNSYNVPGPATVTAYDGNGCNAIHNFTVTPPPVISAPDHSICIGQSVTLNATGANNFTWSAIQPVSPNVTTVYTVTGQLNGCYGSTTNVVVVNPLPTITPNPTITTICVNEKAEFTASGAESYTWAGTYKGPAFVYSFSNIGTFNFGVTGTSANSCTNTAYITIKVEECAGLTDHYGGRELKIFPNPFSDDIRIDVDTGMTQIELKVYNSLGQLFYSGSLETGSNKISLSEIPEGLYHIMISEGEEQRLYQSVNMVKEKNR